LIQFNRSINENNIQEDNKHKCTQIHFSKRKQRNKSKKGQIKPKLNKAQITPPIVELFEIQYKKCTLKHSYPCIMYNLLFELT